MNQSDRQMRRSRAFAPLGLGLPVMAFAMYARVLLRFDMSHGHFPFYQQYYALASQGKWPWIDYNLEYPPLSIPFIFGPTLFLKGLSPLAVALCRITWALVCTLVVFYGCAVRELQIRKFPVATVVFGFSIVLASCSGLISSLAEGPTVKSGRTLFWRLAPSSNLFRS